jgi:acyl-CoA thioester hydrolase
MTDNQIFKFFHTTPIQIRFNDFDSLAHVNNSVYQNYFDLARTSYFDLVLQEKMQWNIRGLVLKKVSLEFIRPILMDDKVEVQTKINRLGNKSLSMYQQIICANSGETMAICESIMVSFCKSADKPCPIPDEWRIKIGNFEKDIEF